MRIYMLGYFMVLFFFIFGYLIAVISCNSKNIVHIFAVSLPNGCGVWAVLWIYISLFLNFYNSGLNMLATFISLFIYICLFLFLSFSAFKAHLLNISNIKNIFFSAIIILIFYTIFFNLKIVQITGDSWKWVTWSTDVKFSIVKGFPLFNLSIANISTLISADYYLYSLQYLFGVSLILLVFNFLYTSFRNVTGLAKWLVPLLIIIIFVFNSNFLRILILSNHHIIHSIYFLLFVMCLSNFDSTCKLNYLYIPFLFLLITVTRMEGFLYATLAFFVFSFFNDSFRNRKVVVAISYVLVIPYVLILLFLTWDDGFVSGYQYLIMVAFFFTASLFMLTEYYEKAYINFNVNNYIIYILLFALLAFVFMDVSRMLSNINTYFYNIFSLRWGLLNYFVLTFTILFALNKDCKLSRKSQFYLQFFCMTVILTIILSFFRAPLKEYWFDSANRIYFHFLPILIIFLGYHVSILFQTRKQFY